MGLRPSVACVSVVWVLVCRHSSKSDDLQNPEYVAHTKLVMDADSMERLTAKLYPSQAVSSDSKQGTKNFYT